MSSLEIPLCIHGETNGFVMDREAEFGSPYMSFWHQLSKSKIFMEHITTGDSVELLEYLMDNLYGHVLFLTPSVIPRINVWPGGDCVKPFT